jgi:Fibronectin type III domain
MAAHAPRTSSARWHWRSGAVALAAAAGLALFMTAQAVSSAAGATTRTTAATGIPELLTPRVTHEPDAYELLSVGCFSVKYCLAVGYGDGTFTGGVAIPIRNGVPGKPILSSDSASIFRAAACVSASECIVAGSEPAQGKTAAQAVVWLLQGSKLSLLPQSTATSNVSADFTGATCRGRTCEVVGNATYITSTKAQQPIAIFAGITLRGSPKVDAVDNTALGYASSVSCPKGPVCFAGGATTAGIGAEAYITLRDGEIRGPFAQPDVSGIDGLACPSFTSCGAAEVENLTFPQTSGWVEKLNQLSSGKPAAVTGAQLMLGIAVLNQGYYLAVGAGEGGSWLTDLVTASGKPRPAGGVARDGYLQAVSCPAQTECVAVGFSPDSDTHQPGGSAGVDGAIAVFRLRTAPSAPGLNIAGRTRSSVTLRIGPPASNGGATVRSYDLVVTRCKPHHSGCLQQPVRKLTSSGRTRSITISHLASSTTFYFEARAVNAIGAGPYSGRVHARTT